jgi:hypothetical protein
VLNAYTKGDLFCVYQDRVVTKVPLQNIWRIVESYVSATKPDAYVKDVSEPAIHDLTVNPVDKMWVPYEQAKEAVANKIIEKVDAITAIGDEVQAEVNNLQIVNPYEVYRPRSFWRAMHFFAPYRGTLEENGVSYFLGIATNFAGDLAKHNWVITLDQTPTLTGVRLEDDFGYVERLNDEKLEHLLESDWIAWMLVKDNTVLIDKFETIEVDKVTTYYDPEDVCDAKVYIRATTTDAFLFTYMLANIPGVKITREPAQHN